MGTKLSLAVGSSRSIAELFDDQAPETVRALLGQLPIMDRTIQVRWSGDAWRTEGNYRLLPKGTAVENKAERLAAGDIIYFPGEESGNLKVGIAYGQAQWLGPFMEPVDVGLIGRITDGLEEFVRVSERIIFDGPLDVQIEVISGPDAYGA